MTKEKLKKIAEEVANVYQMPSLASGLYLDFAIDVALKAYLAGQEAKQEISFIAGFDEGRKAENSRILSEIEKMASHGVDMGEYVVETKKCYIEKDTIIELINTKE